MLAITANFANFASRLPQRSEALSGSCLDSVVVRFVSLEASSGSCLDSAVAFSHASNAGVAFQKGCLLNWLATVELC